jgi:hypothetical protein
LDAAKDSMIKSIWVDAAILSVARLLAKAMAMPLATSKAVADTSLYAAMEV